MKSVSDISGKNMDNDVVDILQHEDDDLNLSGAYLPYADLSQLDLRNTNLIGANLDHADLRAADLRGADLSKINLNQTKLTGAIFDTQTKMTIDKREAIMRGMVFLESDGEPDVVITSGEDDFVSDQES